MPRPASSGRVPPLGALEELSHFYEQVDAIFAGFTCDGSTDCCRFGVTGREPYPTSIELALLERALSRRGGIPKRRTLPLAGERRCELLSDGGRCVVYESRPLGCRSFFCERGRGPNGEEHEDAPRALREKIREIARRIADLSARAFPEDPGPRPLSNAMSSWGQTASRRRYTARRA